jgi:hypothetical protein
MILYWFFTPQKAENLEAATVDGLLVEMKSIERLYTCLAPF